MKWRVVLSPRAKDELHAIARWWSKYRSPQQAERWYDGFIESIQSLSHDPERCPLARETGHFPYEIQVLHYGVGSRPTHRAVFTIRPDMVFVLTIRHVAQADLTEDEHFG